MPSVAAPDATQPLSTDTRTAQIDVTGTLAPAAQAAPAPATNVATVPIDFAVTAPSAVNVLDPFEASVRIALPAGMHRLRLSVSYDRRKLELTGVAEGDLARGTGEAVDMTVDEPSDGNVEVTFAPREGRASLGSEAVAVLHFQPRREGTVEIAVRNLTAFDATGAPVFTASAHRSATVVLR